MATKPPLQQLSPNNHGPVVVVSSIVFTIVAFITVLTRLLTRFRITHKFVIDDGLISFAMFLGIAQTAALVVACNHGLGRHRSEIQSSTFEGFTKAAYAAEILLIASLALTKASVACLIKGLHPPDGTIYACYATIALVVLWSASSILALSFQCQLPSPWNIEGKCIDLFALDVYNTTLNVLTDVALVLVPLQLMWKVQVVTKKRWLVIGFFASRLIAVAFSIVAVITRHRAFDNPGDLTWELVESAIWTQGMLAMSIMTACLPSIRRFLGDLRTGMMVVQISEPLERTLKHSMSTTSEIREGPNSSFSSKQDSRTSKQSQIRASVTIIDEDEREEEEESSGSPGHHKSKKHFRGQTSHHRSEGSRVLSEHVILHTIDYEVKYQDEDNDRQEISMNQSAPSFRPSSENRVLPKSWSQR